MVPGELVFCLPDPDHEHRRVALWCDVELGVELEMRRAADGWELRLPTPDLDCLEYLFDVDGELVPDPTNPRLVDGAFGPHSFLPLPGYREPAWLAKRGRRGQRSKQSIADIDVEVWEPTRGGALPLLLVHDGPQMDEYGAITRYAATRASMRVALLSPGSDRDERYAANPAYAATLTDEVVPELTAAYETVGKPVLVGESLGALAALHAAWTSPGAFAGLMLQSGSFFTSDLDPQEREYSKFAAVSGFVATVMAAEQAAPGQAAVVMTCGTAEENLANNLAMRDHLRSVGLAVEWGTARQGHTWTCWRDTLDPHLGSLLERVWN